MNIKSKRINKISKNAGLILIFIMLMIAGFSFNLFSQDDSDFGYFLGYDEVDLTIDKSHPLSLQEDDVVFVKREDKFFDIYIRKKPQIESVLITTIPSDDDYVTKEVYGLRGTDYNPVNGDEPRLFDGEFLRFEEPIYFLVDSSSEPALPFFDKAFHILVPSLLEYGYEYVGQYGTIRLEEGVNINIRTYSSKYADNRAEFVDNIFEIRFNDNPPIITLLGYEEINDDYIKVFIQYEDDRDFDSMFIKENYPKKERFKLLDVSNNVVPEDMMGQLKGKTDNPDGSISLRIHIDIKKPEKDKRTIMVSAMDKSANSVKSPVVFTILPKKEEKEVTLPEPERDDETPIPDPTKYDNRTVDAFREIANETGGRNLVSESPEDLPAKIIRTIKEATEGYDGDDLDLVFAIDSTGSMKDDIDYVKKELKSILKTITDRFQFGNLGIVLYKDKGDDFVTKGFPFTQDLTRVKLQIDSIRPEGGGDKPEAIIEALMYTINEFDWTAGKRVVILMGDAPPHPTSRTGDQSLTMDDVYASALDQDITIQIYTITVPTI
jgi:hypothetical protein